MDTDPHFRQIIRRKDGAYHDTGDYLELDADFDGVVPVPGDLYVDRGPLKQVLRVVQRVVGRKRLALIVEEVDDLPADLDRAIGL